MKAIHLIDRDKSIITFNKGGSTLFTYTLKLFLNWKGIELKGEWKGGGETFVISRNPINRFFSGFLHSHTVPRGGDWDFVERGDIIRRMEKWIEGCKSNAIRDDWHYQRQGVILDEMGLTPNATYKIEDIGDEINRMANWGVPNSNPDWSTTEPLVRKGGLGLLDSLDIPMSGWDWQILIGFWKTVERNLEWGHHRGGETRLVRMIIESERPDLMREIKEWLGDDIKRFRYGNII